MLAGFDHVAVLTADLERFVDFYREVFGAQVDELRDELIRRGCTDSFVTDFGHVLSVFFRDPEGPEFEVCVGNPDAAPGRINPPGTPATRYHPA